MDNTIDTISVVLCTVPSGSAHEITRTLLDQNLVACVNIVPASSLYRWEGEVCEEAEELLIIKTTTERVAELTENLVRMHPYQVPEVVSLPVADGFKGYLAWVAGEIKKG